MKKVNFKENKLNNSKIKNSEINLLSKSKTQIIEKNDKEIEPIIDIIKTKSENIEKKDEEKNNENDIDIDNNNAIKQRRMSRAMERIKKKREKNKENEINKKDNTLYVSFNLFSFDIFLDFLFLEYFIFIGVKGSTNFNFIFVLSSNISG